MRIRLLKRKRKKTQAPKMELVLIEPYSPEWDFMWDWLANHPLNLDIPNPSAALNDGEAWQYMGSYMQGEKVIHQFRHRNHPVTNGVKQVSVNGSEAFTKEQIAKKFRL